MPITFDVDPGSNTVRVSVAGETIPAEFAILLEQVAAHPDFEPRMNFLVDVREHRTVTPTEFFWELSRRIDPATTRNAKWALVVSRVVSEGLGLMLGTLLQNAGITVKVFRELEAAEAWLRKGPDAS